MVVEDTLRIAIANSSDTAWLNRCRDHNASLSRKEIVALVEQRLRDLDLQKALRVRPEAHTLDARVYEGLRVYREILKHKHFPLDILSGNPENGCRHENKGPSEQPASRTDGPLYLLPPL